MYKLWAHGTARINSVALRKQSRDCGKVLFFRRLSPWELHRIYDEGKQKLP